MIIPIRLSISNAFLVTGARPVLIDTGCPGDHAALVQAMTKAGVAARDLALILHTHGHRDHAGGTHALTQLTQAPTAVHAADRDMLQRGANRRLIPFNLTGRLLRPFVDKPFPPVEPDRVVDEQTDLRCHGLAGRILETPGHTAGSISILLDNGEALAGDLLIGGYLGGMFAAHRPGYPYFLDELAQVQSSIRKLLAAGAKRLYVGHGGPLTAEAIQAWLASARVAPAACPSRARSEAE